MSFRGARLNSSVLRRQRIFDVEANAAFSKAVDTEALKNEVIADLPLVFDGGSASEFVQAFENTVTGNDGYIESSSGDINAIAIVGGGA